VGFACGEGDLWFDLGEVVEFGDVVGTWLSRCQFEYLAQALNFQLVTARILVALRVEAFDEDGAGVA